MRITAFLACLIVALDCANTAIGNSPPKIFEAGSIWLWWIVSGWWLTSGFLILFRGAA